MFFNKKNNPPIRFSTVITFSSLDDPFIDACIDGVMSTSECVVCLAYETLFDGADERRFLDAVISRNKHKAVAFKILPLPVGIDSPDNSFFHNYIRRRGFEVVQASADYTMFVDGDEIADAGLLSAWKARSRKRPASVLFSSYWYFREAIYQSTTLETAAIMVNNSVYAKRVPADNTELLNFHRHERQDYRFDPMERVKKPVVFHHFSWVRTKEEMLKKVKNWGHRLQEDWVSKVDAEFSHPFNGTDFVHGYRYRTVANRFNITL